MDLSLKYILLQRVGVVREWNLLKVFITIVIKLTYKSLSGKFMLGEQLQLLFPYESCNCILTGLGW